MTVITDPPSPPAQTRLLKVFSIASGYDQIHLDIGDIRYFVYPELAVALAQALLRHAEKLRPSKNGEE